MLETSIQWLTFLPMDSRLNDFNTVAREFPHAVIIFSIPS